MMSADWDLPILVSGASGKLGRLIVSQLLDTHRVPADQIIATTRAPDSLGDFARRGVVVRKADFAAPAGLAEAFRDAQRVLIVSITPEWPYETGKRARLQIGAVNAAVEAGAKHVLLTSAPNPEPGNPAFWHADHYQTELALIESGLRWTIMRVWDWPDAYCNRLWKPALDRGLFYTAASDGGMSYLSREDTAAAAAGALLSNTSAYRRFDLTGPEVLTEEAIMSMLTTLTGRVAKVVHCSPEQWAEDFLAQGGAEHLVELVKTHMLSQKMGLFGGLTNAVEELSGRKPTTMAAYLPKLVEGD